VFRAKDKVNCLLCLGLRHAPRLPLCRGKPALVIEYGEFVRVHLLQRLLERKKLSGRHHT
jgi:hypothetical protein